MDDIRSMLHPKRRGLDDDLGNSIVQITKASMLAEFFFALAISSGMSCVP